MEINTLNIILIAAAIAIAIIYFKVSGKPIETYLPQSTHANRTQSTNWFVQHSHHILRVVPFILYGLFHLLCIYTLNASGHDVLIYWWHNGSSQWATLIQAAVLMLLCAGLLVKFIGTIYTRSVDVRDIYVFLGNNLNNGAFFYNPKDSLKTIISSIGDEPGQWFYDHFFDLKKEVVLRFGPHPEDVSRADEIGLSSAITSFIVLLVVFLALLSTSFGIIGTYIDQTVIETTASLNESPIITAYSWFWGNYTSSFISILALLIIPSILIVVMIARNEKALQHRFKTELIEKLPSTITPKNTQLGTIVNSTTTDLTGGQLYNLLIKFNGVYDVPIWLRMSMIVNKKNAAWVQDIIDNENIQKYFMIQDDLSIWPDDLAIDERF